MRDMGSDTQAEPKAQIRARLRAARDAADDRARVAAAVRLWARLRHLRGATLAGYLPLAGEVDPRGAMRALSHDNNLCVPVVAAQGTALRFREWWPGCPTAPGAFGVEEPVTGGWRIPDVLIVPVLGFDATGVRLGYGGGFYDRTLAGLPGARTIGVALEAQRVDRLPRDATDVPLMEIVTEAGLYRPDPPE